eukprot:PhF_6_TR44119/c0_g1_i4/m.67340
MRYARHNVAVLETLAGNLRTALRMFTMLGSVPSWLHKLETTLATLKIQRTYRAHLARHTTIMLRHGTQILFFQMVGKGFVMRKRLGIQQKALLRIFAHLRGLQDRYPLGVQYKRNMLLNLQTILRGYQARCHTGKGRTHKLGVVLLRTFKGYHARHSVYTKWRLREQSLIRVQSLLFYKLALNATIHQVAKQSLVRIGLGLQARVTLNGLRKLLMVVFPRMVQAKCSQLLAERQCKDRFFKNAVILKTFYSGMQARWCVHRFNVTACQRISMLVQFLRYSHSNRLVTRKRLLNKFTATSVVLTSILRS